MRVLGGIAFVVKIFLHTFARTDITTHKSIAPRPLNKAGKNIIKCTIII